MLRFLKRNPIARVLSPNLQIHYTRLHAKPSGSESNRRLTMERLENRTLLTGLIASAEIAPGPVAEFTEQARTFIESALEHVMQTQHQSPVASRVDSSTGQASDGRPIRTTNYTVELEPTLSHGTTSPRNSPVLLNDVPQSSINISNTSSQLVFSFVIYADNTVSARARLTGPQFVSFISPSLKLSAGVSEDFARTWDDGTESGRFNSERPQTYPSQRSAYATEDALSEDQPAKSSMATPSSRTSLDAEADQPAKQNALGLFSAEMFLDLPDVQLPQATSAAIDGSSSINKNSRESSCHLADSSFNATDAKSAAEMSRKLPSSTTDAPPIAVPLGMIGLQFPDDTFTTASGGAPESASALFQVFIQSPAENRLVLVAPLPANDGAAGWRGHDELEDSRADRWQRASLVILALTSGYMLCTQKRRSSLLKTNKQAGQSNE